MSNSNQSNSSTSKTTTNQEESQEQTVPKSPSGWSRLKTNEKFLHKAYIVVLLAALPIGIYLIFGQPIGLLQLAGGIEAAHIPIVTGLTLYLNHRMLPEKLRPSKLTLGATAIAGLFFAAFAVIYLLQLIGVLGGGSGSS